MNFLFAAGDIGGARAILPVARLAEQQGHRICALAHGTLKMEGAASWQWLDVDEAKQTVSTQDVVIYATSVVDTLAAEIAQAAQFAGIPCLHVLDNWSSYAERIQVMVPDAYTVMDSLALSEALTAGIAPQLLHITGHPDLAKLALEKTQFSDKANPSFILFVSEPAAHDGGTGVRGYDERIVSAHLVSALAANGASDSELKVVPHPREDRQLVAQRMQALYENTNNAPDWSMVLAKDVRSALHQASHVVGMSSLLLYEAWLLGKPTLSLQPGLRGGILQALSHRQGLIFHDQVDGIEAAVGRWLSLAQQAISHDLHLHENAAQSVLTLAGKLVNEHSYPDTDKLTYRDARYAENVSATGRKG